MENYLSSEMLFRRLTFESSHIYCMSGRRLAYVVSAEHMQTLRKTNSVMWLLFQQMISLCENKTPQMCTYGLCLERSQAVISGLIKQPTK